MTSNAATVPPIKRIVPWKYREEWLDVYFSAFSNNLEKQQFALERILIWKIRSCENLSLALDLTWQLLSVKLKDAENKEIHFLDDNNMKELYGIYIIRFVNYTLEACQNGKNLISLKRLADKIGLPQWILNLRHSLTYGTLPELGVLRDAVDQALHFLEENYWKSQAQYTISDESECQIKFKSLLEDHFHLINELKNKPNLTDFKASLQKLELYVQANCKVFLKTLSENEYLLFPLSNSGDVLQIPKNISENWKHIFNQLRGWNLSQAFLEGLLGRLSEESSDWDRCILAWTCIICKKIVKHEKVAKLNFEANKILFLAMERPNKFTPNFVDKFCGMFPELFKHRVEMLSLLTAYGINHPWQNNYMEFDTLEERGQQKAKDTLDHRETLKRRSYRNSSIVNIERKEWMKILRSLTSFEPKLYDTQNSRKRTRQNMESSEYEPPLKHLALQWKFRCHDDLSTASEITQQLLSLKQLNEKNEQLHFLTDYQMRSLYGMHVIRFIEKTLQRHKKNKMSTSLENVAKKVGLPMWMVDLRHEAAHQSPPELFILRDAVDLALKFLKMDYWIPQTLYNAPEEAITHTSFDEFLNLIRLIKDHKGSNLSANSRLQEMELHIQSNCKELFETLLNVKTFTLISSDNKDQHTGMLNPGETAIEEWTPVLNQLIEWNLSDGLLEYMLGKLTEVGSDQDQNILSWTCFICNEENQKKHRIASNMNFDSKKILYKGTIRPNKFTPFFVNTICCLFPELSKYRFNLLSILNAHGYAHPWQECHAELDITINNNVNNEDNSTSKSQAGQALRETEKVPVQNAIAITIIDENDKVDWWNYPIGVDPMGYFGSIYKSLRIHRERLLFQGIIYHHISYLSLPVKYFIVPFPPL